MAKKQTEQTQIQAPYELPEGWKWEKTNSLADIFTGNSINENVKKEKYTGISEGLNFIGTKDIDFDGTINYENGVKISDYENFKTVPENTPLLCIEGGSAGKKLGITSEKVCFGNKLCAFVCKNVEPKLVYYYLQSNAFFYSFMNERHGLIGGVSVGTLKNIPFPLPPTLTEQQRIVSRIESLFSKLDSAKEKAQNVVDSFENRKAAILHKAFTGELTKKWRAENGVGEDSWVEKMLSEVCTKITDGTHNSPPNTENGDYMYITAKNIKENGIDLSNITFVSKEIHNEIYSRCNVEKGDVLYIKDGATTGIATINTLDEQFSLLSSVADLKPNKLLLNSKFLSYVLNSSEVKAKMLNEMSGNAITRLTLVKIKQAKIPICNLAEQTEIVRILDVVLEKENKAKKSAEAVLEQIELLKKSILARAFRGEL